MSLHTDNVSSQDMSLYSDNVGSQDMSIHSELIYGINQSSIIDEII